MRGQLTNTRTGDWVAAVSGAGGAGSRNSFTYDSPGRVSAITTRVDGSSTPSAYRNESELTYNPAGQILSRTTSNNLYANTAHYDVARDYTVNGLNQYVTAGPAAFTYDANGNLTGDGAVTFLYDIENRLVKATGVKNATLYYDPLGRLWKIDPGPAAGDEQILLHDGDALTLEYNAAGAITRRYVHGAGAGVDDPLVWYEGSPVSVNNRRHLWANWQGSIAAIVDASGEIIQVNGYDAYGIPNDTNIGRFAYTRASTMSGGHRRRAARS